MFLLLFLADFTQTQNLDINKKVKSPCFPRIALFWVWFSLYTLGYYCSSIIWRARLESVAWELEIRPHPRANLFRQIWIKFGQIVANRPRYNSFITRYAK